jgi:hypothetical protein
MNALGQRAKILTQILVVVGFRVVEAYFEDPTGWRIWPAGRYLPSAEVRLVLRVQRRWAFGGSIARNAGAGDGSRSRAGIRSEGPRPAEICRSVLPSS